MRRRPALVAMVVATCVTASGGAAGAATAASAVAASSTDRITVDYSTLPAPVVARRALGAMKGDHSVDAELTIENDTEPHVIKGNVDPDTGDARVSYVHVVEDDPSSATPNEVRIHNKIGYGAISVELRKQLLADWYRYKLSDTTLSPPDILIGSLVATSPSGASKVKTWKQAIDTTFGPKTRHFSGTATAKDALPLIGSGANANTVVAYDMWVDHTGELRRLRWVLPGSTKAGTSSLTLSVDFRDRHKSLVVSAPLKNVVDLADLVGTNSTT